MQKSRFDDQRCDIRMSNSQNTDRQNSNSQQLEDIFNTVDRLQQSRLDDQRTNFPKPTQLPPLNEQFFDQLAKCQVRLINLYPKRSIFLSLYLGFTYERSTSCLITTSYFEYIINITTNDKCTGDYNTDSQSNKEFL